MGNGLRVVVGAVAASDGRLTVETRGTRYTLAPAPDGSTHIDAAEPIENSSGTRIEITLGPAIPADKDAPQWAKAAIIMAPHGESYAGRPSPWWYDADAFFELLRSAGRRPVREVIEQLDGCAGAKAGSITRDVRGVYCDYVTREQAVALLAVARHEARPVRPKRLGSVGRGALSFDSYACRSNTALIGGREPKAETPFVVEAWGIAEPREGKDDTAIAVYVNRTPITGYITAWRSGGKLNVDGCGLDHEFAAPPGRYAIVLNLTAPWCPITTDGKEPDLSPFAAEIAEAIAAVARKAKSALPKQSASETGTHKDIVLRNLASAVEKASGGGQYRFNQRQLYYVLRPVVADRSGKELDWGNFQKIITAYENEVEDIAGMYRDPRGTLYHPHTGEDISLGTLAVENYRRPAWTFGQILYLEKEGFFEALKAARWPERHDCALVTSKGYSSRAVRDLLDLLGDGEEPIRVFCVHDADASGTMIYQTLQEETKARARRRVEVVNLGLDPWEALAMGLEPEAVEAGDRSKPVADYVRDRQDGYRWQRWFQSNRVELNEMTTAALIEWLDGKMAEHGAGKVIPPASIVATETQQRLTSYVEDIVTERVLREAKVGEQVETIVSEIQIPSPNELTAAVKEWVGDHEAKAWSNGVSSLVEDIARDVPR